MGEMSKQRKWIGTQTAEQRAATLRMALFPENAEVLFVGEDIWVVSLHLSSFFDALLTILSACGSSGREALYLPWDPCIIHKNVTWPDAIHTIATKARASFANTDLYGVSATPSDVSAYN